MRFQKSLAYPIKRYETCSGTTTKLVDHNPEQFKIKGCIWTRDSVRELIKQNYGIVEFSDSTFMIPLQRSKRAFVAVSFHPDEILQMWNSPYPIRARIWRRFTLRFGSGLLNVLAGGKAKNPKQTLKPFFCQSVRCSDSLVHIIVFIFAQSTTKELFYL